MILSLWLLHCSLFQMNVQQGVDHQDKERRDHREQHLWSDHGLQAVADACKTYHVARKDK